MARRLGPLLRNAPWRSTVRAPCIIAPRMDIQHRNFCGLQQTIYTPSIITHELIGQRFYAKGKNKGKDKGKKSAAPKVALTSDELNSVVKYDKMLESFQHVLDQLQRDYMTKLSIRTNAASFDQLDIETNDGAFPLIQLAQIAQKSPTLVVVNLAGFPQYIPDVKGAFLNIGINPTQEGNSLIVPIPKVTREQRQKMADTAKMMCNKSKDKLRDVQNSFLRDVKKQKGKQSDDLIQSVHDYIQKDAHDYQSKAEGLMATKQKELLNS